MNAFFHIKRLYRYILTTFIPLFLMTFAICLFLVLMQFLWKYVEDMVGKGLGLDVLGEMFFYAALNLIPMALPLAILLASLMVFGNLGENLELLAIKSAGIPLLTTMKPLIILIAFISVGAFFFQNNTIPRIQTKFYSCSSPSAKHRLSWMCRKAYSTRRLTVTTSMWGKKTGRQGCCTTC